MANDMAERVARAKRLCIITDGMEQVSENLELTVGQFNHLNILAGRPPDMDIEECETVIRKELDYLKLHLDSWTKELVRDLAGVDSAQAYQLEKPSVLREADNILRSKNDG